MDIVCSASIMMSVGIGIMVALDPRARGGPDKERTRMSTPETAIPETDAPGQADATPSARPKLADPGSLRANQLLSHLPPEVIGQVEKACRWLRLDTNAVAFDQEDASQDVYFIVEGRLRIVVFRDPPQAHETPGPGAPTRQSTDSPQDQEPSETEDQEAEAASIKAGIVAFEALVDEGAPMTLTEMQAGDTFGELSAIDGRMRSARAVALEPSLVAVLDGRLFVQLVQQNGDFAVALLRRVAGYLRASNRRMYNLSALTAKQRIFAQLARLAEVNPTQPEEWIIEPVPSHVDIGFWAGAKRETVAAAIGWLAREGIVVRQNRALRVREPARLKALAHA
jgi:CRP-like cAMP-binding protein